MMLVIRTQFQENYAAHQGFTGEYRWKMKGGSDRVTILFTITVANRIKCYNL